MQVGVGDAELPGLQSRGLAFTLSKPVRLLPAQVAAQQALDGVGQGVQVDLRTDVYSTGAVVYFTLTGQRPFDSEDPTSTLSMRDCRCSSGTVRSRSLSPSTMLRS